MVQLGVDWTEVGIGLDALDEVIVTPFLLDHGSCLLREHSDFLMAILAVTPAFTMAMMMFSVAMKAAPAERAAQ